MNSPDDLTTKRKTRADLPLESQLLASWPLESWRNVSVLVAISGGPDSVALLCALSAIIANETYRNSSSDSQHTARIEAAHFNHRWRGDESDNDESFVRSLCTQLGIACHVGRPVKTPLADQTEEAARNARYEFLHDVAKRQGTRYLVTAHTEDDQAETILHRVIRGTGLRGLQGIRPRRRLSEAVTVVRPMLTTTRVTVLEYLNQIGQPYRVDSSNVDCRYTRNRIRTELLPQLAQNYNPSVAESLLRLGRLAQEANAAIQPQVDRCLRDCILLQNAKSVELDKSKLLACDDFVRREALLRIWRQQEWPERRMGSEDWRRITSSLHQTCTVSLPGDVRLEVNDKLVQLSRPTF